MFHVDPPLVEHGRNPLDAIHVRFHFIEPDEYLVPIARSYTLHRIDPQDPISDREVCDCVYQGMDQWRW